MPSSEVEICNLALGRLGAAPITDFADDSQSAMHCGLVYGAIRDQELRKYPWNFALRRVQLAADATAPVFGFSYAYTLPADFIRFGITDEEVSRRQLDWVVEDGKILTEDTAPLNFPYVYRLTDVSRYDPLFVTVLKLALAIELCEVVTNSGPDREKLLAEYAAAFAKAAGVTAQERAPRRMSGDYDDELILARY